jgi:succinate-semialdehyde dehydrogenase/glutarate-semialdehyde dehydrogenase
VPVTNPATGEVIAEVAKCSTAETRRAIEAAAAAFPEWSKRTAKERAACLRKWFNLMMEAQEDLALIMTLEQGKPLAESRGEIAYGANYIEWFAEEAKRIYGDTIPQPSNDKRIVCIKQPVGVVACITPWNFPNAMLTRKIAPALAIGCTVVCKPANATPLSAYAFVELAERAGIPPGVINMVTGETAAIGREMTSNPTVRKLTFTGSTPVGKQLMAECAQTVKRTSMELGGNAPFIVFDDARRSRRRGCGCSHQQVPQRGSDLCLRQSPAGAVRLLRRFRRKARGRGGRPEDGRRHRGRRYRRAADQ